MSARIRHHVDRGGATEHLSARGFDAAAVEVWLRLGVKAPVEQAPLVQLAHAERHVDERMRVAPTRLEQEHPRCVILAQAIGEHAPGRAGTDDDVVVASGISHASWVVENLQAVMPRRARAYVDSVS